MQSYHVCIVFFSLLVCIQAISLDLLLNQERCIRRDFRQDTLVTGIVEIKPIIPNRRVYFKISDSEKNPVYENRDTNQGNFAFTTQHETEYSFCFLDQPVDGQPFVDSQARMIKLTIQEGEKAKDYAEVARKEKLKPIELELRKMEDVVARMKEDFSQMKNREARHRDTTESTNGRVLWMSFLSLCILTSLGLWQIYYLKTYFKSKKLI